jgi:hypothetical protein
MSIKLRCYSKICVNFGYFGYYRNRTEFIWLLPKPNRIFIRNRIYRSIEIVFTEKPINRTEVTILKRMQLAV